MGVHTPRLESAVMVYSTGLAGLGGALYASLYSLEPAMGGVFVLKAMEAAILGGIGSLMGSLLGGVILGVTEGVGSIFLPSRSATSTAWSCSWRSCSSGPPGSSGANERQALLWGSLYALPLFVRSDFLMTILIFTWLQGILAVTFDLIFGFTGQLSMFHPAAFGIAAYRPSSCHPLHAGFWTATLPSAPLAVVSVVVGTICFRFRLKEFYFAVVTLAFSEMTRSGDELEQRHQRHPRHGVAGKPASTGCQAPRAYQGDHAWYYLTLAALSVTLLICSRCLSSWMGRSFWAIRLNLIWAHPRHQRVPLQALAFVIGNVSPPSRAGSTATTSARSIPAFSASPLHGGAGHGAAGGTGLVIGPIVGAVLLIWLPHPIHFSRRSAPSSTAPSSSSPSS